MTIGTPNPDFNAEPWCTEEPAPTEKIFATEDVPPAPRNPIPPNYDAE